MPNKWIAQIAYKNELYWKVIGETQKLENALILLQNEILDKKEDDIVKVLVVCLPLPEDLTTDASKSE